MLFGHYYEAINDIQEWRLCRMTFIQEIKNIFKHVNIQTAYLNYHEDNKKTQVRISMVSSLDVTNCFISLVEN